MIHDVIIASVVHFKDNMANKAIYRDTVVVNGSY